MLNDPHSCCNCGSKKFLSIYEPKSIVQCPNCHLRMVYPISKQIISYNDKYYDTFSGSQQDLDEMWSKRLATILMYKKNGTLLDIGAGTGNFLKLATRYFNAEGTEISPYANGRAKKLYGVTIYEKPLGQIHKNYDIVTLWHVLEHLENPKQSLNEIHKLLKENGLLIIAIPNDDSMKQKIKKALNYKTLYFDAPPSRENHLYFFVKKTLEAILDGTGFIVEKVKADDYYGKRSAINNLRYFVSNLSTEYLPIYAASCLFVVARRKG